MKKLFLLCFLSIILLANLCRIVESNLASDRRALLAIRTAIGARFLPWNISDYTPCSWTGVTCLHNRVVELRLQLHLMGPIGQLPTVHGNLTQQRNLTLPPDIGNLASLRNLYLQGNLFSGEIPGFLFNLRNLGCLNLAHNNFTGRVSVNFNKLTRLTTLYLEGNQLSGSIPVLNLASLKHFNVSFNNLTGVIPETLSSMPASSFQGNFLCGKPLLLCNGSSIGDNHKLSGVIPETLSSMTGAGIAGIVIGCFIGCFRQRKVIRQGGDEATEDLKQIEKVEFSIEDGMAVNNTTPKYRGKTALWVAKGEATENVEQKEDIEVSVEEGVADSDHAATAVGGGDTLGAVIGQSSLEFDLEDLLRAPAELLGKGTFGTTYKATFDTGRTVAIKRLKEFNVSEKEFEDMVGAIEKMNNQNLIPVRAYYYSEDQMLLVYEYMHMGSLYALLHGDKGRSRISLNWETRTSIALGAARAILHIHEINPSTCHGNIKSSNVFLTATSKVRVSEFGLASIGGSTNINGYLAPEMTKNGKVSQKADVYSFGVMLLELITGKDPTESHLKDEELDLPKWLLSAVNEEWTSAVFDVELLQHENVEEIMLQFLELAFSCTAQHPDNRPSMAEVVNQIKNLCSPSLQDDRDPAMTQNVFGQIYKGPKAWKIYTRRNRELQQRFNSRANGNTVAGGLVFFGNVQNVFDLEDLLRASAEVLGKGTFGTSYKAILDTGTTICVKRLKDLKVYRDEFPKIVEAVGKINHENLICLRAYYHSKDESLLVQDYMPMGSLSKVLYGSRGSGSAPLNWESRCSIALGVARAIEYIHSQSSAMCHGDIKSSNILLTKTLEVRVSDFGLSRITENHTIKGYRAPEVSDKVSQKADVYSFGVLLLELLTGKAPTHTRLDEGPDLPRWVQSVVEEGWAAEVFDIELLRYQDASEDMVQLLQIALSCIAEDPDQRPSMTKLKFQIKKLVPPSSKVGDSDKSLQQMEDGKLRFGHMISIPDD